MSDEFAARRQRRQRTAQLRHAGTPDAVIAELTGGTLDELGGTIARHPASRGRRS